MSGRGFDFCWRNPGHWDVVDDRRLFAIRGEPGEGFVRLERTLRAPNREFVTLTAAVAWICDELMQEPKP